MLPDLHSTYSFAETRFRVLLFGLIGLLFFSVLGIAFLSPTLVLAGTIGIAAVMVTFYRPTWTLAILAFYLPFEPFILKWVPDELYVYARFGSEMLVYIIAIATLAHMLFGEARLRRTPADVPFLLFVTTLVASAIINLLVPIHAILGIRQILRFMILFFTVVFLAPSRRWLRGVLMGIAVIVALEVLIGGAQAVIGQKLDNFLLPSERRTVGDIQLTAGTNEFWDSGQRVFATMGRYDQLGTFLAFFLLIGVAFLYEKALDDKERLWVWLLAIATVPVLALTYSRSSWFGFVLGFLFIAAYIKRDKRVIAVALIIPMLIALYLGVTGLVVNKLTDTANQTIVQRFFEAFSYERWRGEYYGLGRVYWIVKTLTVVVPNAPIFGFGPARFGAGAVAALGDTTVYDALGLPFGVYGTEGYIDNNWFSLWGETGTLGLFAYLWLYLTLFFACLHVARTSTDKETRALALGVAATMIAVALNAFLGTMLEVRTLAPYLWIMTGMVVSLGKREQLL